MSAQVLIFLLLFGGLQGLLLTLFMLRKKLHRNGYLFLLLYFGVLLLQLTLKVMNKLWLMENVAWLYDLSYHLPFLYGPIVYLFSRQQFQPYVFRIADALHFLPFLFTALFFGFREKGEITSLVLFLNSNGGLVLQLASLAIYHTLALRIRQTYSRSEKNFYADGQRLRLSWLHQFIVLSLLVCSVIAVANRLLSYYYPVYFELRYAYLLLVVFIYWVSYSALNHPALFTVVRGTAGEANASLPRLTVHRPSKKYLNSTLKEEEAARIMHALQLLMQERKLFTNPEITIDILAAQLSTNRHVLSQVLNEKLRLSFYDYINGWRVDEVKQLLQDPSRAEHKIASLAYDAGFNSLSAFNEVFKKMTGQTPSQFRKQADESSRQQRV